MSQRLPKLCCHKATGQAYVRIDGRFEYLGKYGSEEAQERYDEVIARLKREGELGAYSITVGQLALVYLEHASEYYVRDGEPTSELNNVRIALRPLVKRYRRRKAVDLSPRCLKTVREDIIAGGCVRTSINRQVDRIRRMFQWAVSEELVPVATYNALQTVTGLKAGRTKAPEPHPVLPVPEADIAAIEPHVSRQIWAAVQLQLLTGARPSEILTMRECHIDATGEVWEYRPARHKTQHHGKARRIFLGPQAQAIVARFLKDSPTRYLFSPAEAREEFDARRRANRKTALTPSQRKRKRKAKPRKKPGDHYDVKSYRRAIVTACKKAGVADWSPGRLRHNAATRLNETFGDIDAARVFLGHSERSTTQVYAERNWNAARNIAAQIG